jgi:hypothetical protein
MKIDSVFNYNRFEQPYFAAGDLVKLCFTDEIDGNGESMWVRILSVSGAVAEVVRNGQVVREAAGPTQFTGELDNVALNARFPKLGETVAFNIGHIITRWNL